MRIVAPIGLDPRRSAHPGERRDFDGAQAEVEKPPLSVREKDLVVHAKPLDLPAHPIPPAWQQRTFPMTVI